MTFSQIWDAGFKAAMIWIGLVFFWLCFLEQAFARQGLSVLVMNLTGGALAVGFFLWSRRRVLTEKAQAEKEIAALMEEVG